MHIKSPGGLIKTQLAGPSPSHAAGPERDLRMCVANELLGDAGTAGLRTTH